MDSRLDHLPQGKRRDLERVVEVLVAEFEDATKAKQVATRKLGRILKVILFGSHARGDWVDDRASGYRSDYDLLVVVNRDELTDLVEYWASADEALLRDYQTTRRLAAPANFVVHSLAEVNRELQRGRPFFVDIARDGVVLYETDDEPLAKPRPLSPQVALTEAQGYFDEWFPSAANYRTLASDAVARGMPKEAAFLLHQATERLYHCVLLVLTLYSPKSHKLNFLRSQAERLAPALIGAWPRDTRFAQRCWDLLRRAYVDARYSARYRITAQELDWLADHVAQLQALVHTACEAHLAKLGRAADLG